MDYINIGPCPPDEDCAQINTPDYYKVARAECQRYIELLRKHLGYEPEGARLSIKRFTHDFGDYYEVVCYHSDSEEAIDYAYKCESDGPMKWD